MPHRSSDQRRALLKGHTCLLFQVSSFTVAHTTVDPKGIDVRSAALEEMKQSFCPCVVFLVTELLASHSAPLCVASGKVCCGTGAVECAQLASRISAVVKSSADAGEDPFFPRH